MLRKLVKSDWSSAQQDESIRMSLQRLEICILSSRPTSPVFAGILTSLCPQKCMRGWTSMFGVVLFYYRWLAVEQRGQVHFMLMGQRCNKCNTPDTFETPMWYPEEAQKVRWTGR